MTNFFSNIRDGNFMPHGHCFLWREDLLFLHVLGDIATIIAYFTIPLALIYIVRKRNDLYFGRLFLMFALFILLCGLSHLMALINIWHGYYYLEGLIKSATGIISLLTAIVLWRLIPTIVTLPSSNDLKQKVHALETAEKALENSNLKLEQKVAERTRQLEEMARTDVLTGLINRREILDRLLKEIERFERYGHRFSILMIDLDHFKSINDRYGHLGGDQALVQSAKIMQQLCRNTDSLARFGGEEFLLLLPETSLSDAGKQAERYCRALAAEAFILDGQPARITCSIGVAEKTQRLSKTDLIKNADTALYQAKAEGRNCVRVFKEVN